MKSLADANYLRVRDSGIDLLRDYEDVRFAELNFYLSDCPSVKHFRNEIASLGSLIQRPEFVIDESELPY